MRVSDSLAGSHETNSVLLYTMHAHNSKLNDHVFSSWYYLCSRMCNLFLPSY